MRLTMVLVMALGLGGCKGWGTSIGDALYWDSAVGAAVGIIAIGVAAIAGDEGPPKPKQVGPTCRWPAGAAEYVEFGVAREACLARKGTPGMQG